MKLRLNRILILSLLLLGCSQRSITATITHDTQCLIQEYDGSPNFGGIEILERLPKSGYDVDLIRLHQAAALDADNHYERLYFSSGAWYYESDRKGTKEIVISQSLLSTINEIPIEGHFVSFFCQSGTLKASTILTITKGGVSMGMQCDVDLESIQLSDKRFIDYINIFKQVEGVIKSVDE